MHAHVDRITGAQAISSPFTTVIGHFGMVCCILCFFGRIARLLAIHAHVIRITSTLAICRQFTTALGHFGSIFRSIICRLVSRIFGHLVRSLFDPFGMTLARPFTRPLHVDRNLGTLAFCSPYRTVFVIFVERIYIIYIDFTISRLLTGVCIYTEPLGAIPCLFEIPRPLNRS